MIQSHGSSRTSAHYARMGNGERESIHWASLEILQRVGVEVYDEQACAPPKKEYDIPHFPRVTH